MFKHWSAHSFLLLVKHCYFTFSFSQLVSCDVFWWYLFTILFSYRTGSDLFSERLSRRGLKLRFLCDTNQADFTSMWTIITQKLTYKPIINSCSCKSLWRVFGQQTLNMITFMKEIIFKHKTIGFIILSFILSFIKVWTINWGDFYTIHLYIYYYFNTLKKSLVWRRPNQNGYNKSFAQ